MALMNVKDTMARIRDAAPASPIAVFRGGKKEEVNSVFAATVRTQQMVAAKDPDLIGVYDGTMDLLEVENEILSRA